MDREKLLNRIKLWERSGECANALLAGRGIVVRGVDGSFSRFFAAAAGMLAKGKKICYIAPNPFLAVRAREDLEAFTGGKCLLLEPAEHMFYNAKAVSGEVGYSRIGVLNSVVAGNFSALVLPPESVVQYLVSPGILSDSRFTLREGDAADLRKVIETLVFMGYVRTGTVDGKRQFAVRGDILDVYPTGEDLPIRIEFYDDVVDVISVFDPVTQRRTGRRGSVTVEPENEFRMQKRTDAGEIGKKLYEELERRSRKEDPALIRLYKDDISRMLENLKHGADFPGQDRLLPFVIGKECSIFDYVRDCVVFVENKAALLETLKIDAENHARALSSLSRTVFVPDELYDLYMSEAELESRLKEAGAVLLEPGVYMGGEARYESGTVRAAGGRRRDDGTTFFFKTSILSGLSGSSILAGETLKTWHRDGIEMIAAVPGRERYNRFLRELSSISKELPESDFVVAEPSFQGFSCETLGFALVNENTFIRTAPAPKNGRLKKSGYASTDEFFDDIKPGDYVVHDIHGIGIFEGIVTREFDGVTRDYVAISYAEGGKLYLPSLQLGTVHKFIGGDDGIPRISTLGGRDWQAEKEKVRKALRAYVQELAELYAKREKIEGYRFPKDNEWQLDFEERFEFEPTGEQLKCAEDIKRDMESGKPMDRLLCGDVGFGKTEVAFRAAFKAVMGGKQVAFLVPTTVLCKQHYDTASARFRDFPVEIDYLCRFRTNKEAADVRKRLADGKIDIIIGTHALVKGKTEFKDLGLIIVDEEQRFGVLQKEKLKMTRPSADVLFLSATPIPRTLNMSLTKIRDISLITEAPKNRNPVQTYLIPLSDEVVRNAIYREMSRHGQTFVLHNEVKTIEERFEKLKTLVPEARICIAHGQMPERSLERVMMDFVDGKYDVMLCSTIIESGLDIPNANTIIVENGHRLGLAQLYQIRGRVGRSETRAYAYITYPAEADLNPDSIRRLEAIGEFTEFGSGVKVAMRDLEIRGAGSLMGEQQSGNVAVVGYDLYCRMMKDAVDEMYGKPVKKKVDVSVDFTVSTYISAEYIPEADVRMEIHRKIAAIEDREGLDDLVDELLDRFPGEVPDNIINLMHLSLIRALAAKCGLRSVIQKGAVIELDTADPHLFDLKIRAARNTILGKYKGRFNIMAGTKRLYAEFRLSGKETAMKPKLLIGEVEELLKVLSGS
ncbi:MAG: transcription-repair coupling factor [Clostridia bacterium]|nr:transcription-repair coupling factor [Clostridia bacterium]